MSSSEDTKTPEEGQPRVSSYLTYITASTGQSSSAASGGRAYPSGGYKCYIEPPLKQQKTQQTGDESDEEPQHNDDNNVIEDNDGDVSQPNLILCRRSFLPPTEEKTLGWDVYIWPLR
eukprot:gb/GECG01002253.1/.p1 GENE.gb/GECG01002253.1/~~gb/GECG01002253.1/.p1  ORF type:complete len:118 (+),score=24.07 gb/GECG01002253.1/:1-354(+)